MIRNEKQSFGEKIYPTAEPQPSHRSKRLSNRELRRQLGWELIEMNRDLTEFDLKQTHMGVIEPTN